MFSIFVTTFRFDGSDGSQAYLIFQPVHRYFNLIANTKHTKHIVEWKSKGLSNESIKPITTSDNILTPIIS